MFKKASLTVEAALVFPVFLFAVLALIYIIMWFYTAENVQCELVQSARIMSGAISSEDKADINLVRNYNVKINAPILSLISIKAVQRVNARAFTGISSISDYEDDPIVYITGHGSVYHRQISCSYIKINVRGVNISVIDSMRNANREKYKPCEKCARQAESEGYNGTVYISEYGNRYHINRQCKAIARNVMAIRLSQVEDRRPCSKCGGE